MNKHEIITVYEKFQEGTSIDINFQKELKEQGNRPIGVAFVRFDEVINTSIYYFIEEIFIFDTLEFVVQTGYKKRRNVYRINDKNQLIFDYVASEQHKRHGGKIISKVSYSCNGEHGITIWNNEEEGYKGIL